MAPLTTDEGITAYLSAHGKAFVSVKELTGGTANFVWRVTTKNGTTSIVKHAEPFVKSNPTFVFTTKRMAFEASSMSIVGNLLADLKKSLGVGPPDVLDHDLKENVLTMTDGGGEHLKALYANLPAEQVQDIGQRLGKWLAVLHQRTADQRTSIGEGGNPSARRIYRYSYQGLQKAMTSYELGGQDGKLGKKVNETYGSLLQTDDDCVCMGDFWPGNIIINSETLSSPHVEVTVVDWELCRRGVAATDVAQFAAEAYLLNRLSPSNHRLASAFIKSYIGSAKLAEKFWERFLVHWAVHVIFWPTLVPWSTRENLKEVAEYGAEAIEVAMSGDSNRIQQFVDDFMFKLVKLD